MLALFHRRLSLISLFALVAAAISVYYQVFLRGLIRLPPTTDTMTAKISRSVIQTVFAKEQTEVGPSPWPVRCAIWTDQTDIGCRRQSPSCYWQPSAT